MPGGPNGYYTTQKGAYLRSIEISGPYEAAGAGKHAEPPAHFRVPARREPSDENGCAKNDSLDAGAARVQTAGRRREIFRRCSPSIRRRAPKAASSSASSGPWKGCW